jgi:hypothetical protein
VSSSGGILQLILITSIQFLTVVSAPAHIHVSYMSHSVFQSFGPTTGGSIYARESVLIDISAKHCVFN